MDDDGYTNSTFYYPFLHITYIVMVITVILIQADGTQHYSQ